MGREFYVDKVTAEESMNSGLELGWLYVRQEEKKRSSRYRNSADLRYMQNTYCRLSPSKHSILYIANK